MCNTFTSRWLVLAGVVLPGMLTAQIVTDGSVGVGPGGPLAGPAFNIPESLGTLSGSGTNLFHSFSTFNVLTGESATFTTDSSSILNVISRVTGTSPSTINGPLSLVAQNGGSPNLFLINPNGVAFGAGAQIDVPAAFHVSTANHLTFAGGEEVFSADLGADSTFSMAAPEAFGFLGGNGDITFHGVQAPGISVTDPAGSSAFGASSLDVTAANIEWKNSTIAAPSASASVRMVATGSGAVVVPLAGELPDNLAGRIDLTGSTLDVGGGISFYGGPITLTASTISTDTLGAGNAGSVIITGTDVALDNGTIVSSTTLSGGDAGAINITGTTSVTANVDSDGEVEADNAMSVVSSESGGFERFQQTGSAGSVTITGGKIDLARAEVRTRTYSSKSGNTPAAVTLDAGNNQLMLRRTYVKAVTFGATSAGSVTLSGRDVALDDRVILDTATLGMGNAGEIKVTGSSSVTANVDAQGNIVGDFDSRLVIFSEAVGSDTGSAGSVTIAGGQIDLAWYQVTARTESMKVGNTPASVTLDANSNALALRHGFVAADTNGATLGGSVTLMGTDVSLDNTAVRSTAGSFSSTGGAGAIAITGTSSVTANVDAQGNVLPGEDVFFRVDSDSSFSAGSVTITGGKIDLARGQVRATVSGDNLGSTPGSVTLDANSNSLKLRDVRVSAATFGAAPAGAVTLRGADVAMDDGTEVQSTTSGQGVGGDILVTSDSLKITGDAQISSASTGDSTLMVAPQAFPADVPGDAGNIKLIVGSLPIDSGSPVSLLIGLGSSVKTTSAASAGGNIRVETAGTVYLDGGTIETSARGSNDRDRGGDITITNPQLLVLRGGRILANAFGGPGGNITIDTVGLIKSGDSVIDASSENSVDGNVSTNAENTVSAAVEIEPPRAGPPDALGRRCSPAEVAGRSSFLLRGTRPADLRAPYLPVDGLASAVTGKQSVACAPQSPAR